MNTTRALVGLGLIVSAQLVALAHLYRRLDEIDWLIDGHLVAHEKVTAR